MRKEYGQALRKLFETAMAAQLPAFEPKKVKSYYIWPGERAFAKVIGDDHMQCIVLAPNQKQEQFNIELGWSLRSRFPELSMRPSPVSPNDSFTESEYLVRLGELATGMDYWWTVEEFKASSSVEELAASLERIPPARARETVQPVVNQAMEALMKHGMPYLANAAQHVAQRHLRS